MHSVRSNCPFSPDSVDRRGGGDPGDAVKIFDIEVSGPIHALTQSRGETDGTRDCFFIIEKKRGVIWIMRPW